MDKYEDYDYHPRNQHVRRRDGMWQGRSECSELLVNRNSAAALGLRAQGLMPKSTRTPEPPGLKSLEDLKGLM